MTYIDNDKNMHVPAFLHPRFGNVVSIETRKRNELTFAEHWVVANGYFDADSATDDEVIAYVQKRDLRMAIVEPHDAEAWEDFNDFALAA
jgi:hypothetical protein